MTFDIDKKNVLNKIIAHDRSKKGSVDKEIAKLVNELNCKKDYYTTSSCAGRILLIKSPKSGKKKDVEWLLASHKKVTFPQLKKALRDVSAIDEEIWLKQESLILHVACRTPEAAEQMLHITRTKCGLKRAGVITLKRNIIEIVGADSVYVLLAERKKLIVNDSYLKAILAKANRRMDINSKWIERLYDEVKKLS